MRSQRALVDPGAGITQFDCGAQYFTARDPRFESAVTGWLRAGVVAQWRARIVRIARGKVADSRERALRYVGYPAMASLASHSHAVFRSPTRSAQRASSGQMLGGSFAWRMAAGRPPHSQVVAAVPAPRAARLLDGATNIAQRIAVRTMQPCWALMLQFEEDLNARFDAAFIEDGPISWIARESSKPGRRCGERWVVHASGGWSAERCEWDHDEVVAALMKPFCELLEKRVSPAAAATQHWHYSLAPEADGEACLHDSASGLGACGDWLVGGCVEGAFLSGLAMASAFLRRNRESRSIFVSGQ